MINNPENSHMQQPARKRKCGRAFLIFGTIFALLSMALFVLAPTIVPSTIAANRGATGGGLGAAALRGMAIIWAEGEAQAMMQAGIFLAITGLILLAVGVVREYQR